MLKINWAGRFEKYEGYGYFTYQLLTAMSKLNTLDITPVHLHQFLSWPARFFDMAGIDLNNPMLLIHPPDLQFIKQPGRVWCYTMYESTHIFDQWVENLNTYCDSLIVPSVFCAEVFHNCGVHIPTYVIPGGVDPEEYYPFSAKPVDRPYTFMALGDRANRKGWDLVWKALWDVFGKSTDVRLILKCRPTSLVGFEEGISDSRVSVFRKDTDSMAEAFQHADCFVFPTRGEGFGLPPREAAACGVPTICTEWSGTDDYTNEWAFPLGYELRKSRLPAGGKWAEPDYNQLCELMEWCYKNRDEARQKALQHSKWLHTNRTWRIAAMKVSKLLNEKLGDNSSRPGE